MNIPESYGKGWRNVACSYVSFLHVLAEFCGIQSQVTTKWVLRFNLIKCHYDVVRMDEWKGEELPDVHGEGKIGTGLQYTPCRAQLMLRTPKRASSTVTSFKNDELTLWRVLNLASCPYWRVFFGEFPIGELSVDDLSRSHSNVHYKVILTLPFFPLQTTIQFSQLFLSSSSLRVNIEATSDVWHSKRRCNILIMVFIASWNFVLPPNLPTQNIV